MLENKYINIKSITDRTFLRGCGQCYICIAFINYLILNLGPDSEYSWSRSPDPWFLQHSRFLYCLSLLSVKHYFVSSHLRFFGAVYIFWADSLIRTQASWIIFSNNWADLSFLVFFEYGPEPRFIERSPFVIILIGEVSLLLGCLLDDILEIFFNNIFAKLFGRIIVSWGFEPLWKNGINPLH